MSSSDVRIPCSAWLRVLAAIAVLPGVAFAQGGVVDMLKMRLCEVVKEPARFNGKTVQIRGPFFLGVNRRCFSTKAAPLKFSLRVQTQRTWY